MVPEYEMTELLGDVQQAVAMAAAGHLADGYDCLLFGLHRAQQIRASGKPWAHELVRRYRQTLDTYAARYGVRLG